MQKILRILQLAFLKLFNQKEWVVTLLIILITILSIAISSMHAFHYDDRHYEYWLIETEQYNFQFQFNENFFFAHLIWGLIIWPNYYLEFWTYKKNNRHQKSTIIWVVLGSVFYTCQTITPDPILSPLLWPGVSFVLYITSIIFITLFLHLNGNGEKRPGLLKKHFFDH